MPAKPAPFSFDLEAMLPQVMENRVAAACLLLAFRHLRLYEAVAKPLNKRIWEAQRRAGKASDQLVQMRHRRKTTPGQVRFYNSAREKMEHWFAISNAEAHFYLISWDAVGKLAGVIKNCGIGLSAPRQIWRVHQARFKEYKDARDHLEHWIEQLPGRGESTWKMSDVEGGNQLSGNMGRVRIEKVFTFRDDKGRDKKVDISSASADLLEKICKQLREKLTAEVRSLFESGKKIPDRQAEFGSSVPLDKMFGVIDGIVPI